MLDRADLHEIVAIGSQLTAEKDKNLLLEKLLDEAMKISACDAGTLYLYDKGKLTFHVMKTLSQNVSLIGSDITLPPVELREENVCAYAAIRRELVNIPDVYDSERFDFAGPKRYDTMTRYHTRSMLVVPLEDSEQQLIGVLQLINKLDGSGEIIPFTEDDEFSLQSLGSMTAVSLANMIYSEIIRDSSKTFSAFLFVYCGWMIVNSLWAFLGQPVSTTIMTCAVEVLSLLVFFYVIRKTDLKLSDLGIQKELPWKSIGVGLVTAVCAVFFLCIAKAVLRIFSPDIFGPEYPFFDFRAFGVWQIVFILTAGIHQLLARSVIQSNLQRIMVGRHTADAAIVITAMAFATMFAHMGFVFVLFAALLALLEGILYEKQRTIYSVWVVHWIVGVAAVLLHIISY